MKRKHDQQHSFMICTVTASVVDKCPIHPFDTAIKSLHDLNALMYLKKKKVLGKPQHHAMACTTSYTYHLHWPILVDIVTHHYHLLLCFHLSYPCTYIQNSCIEQHNQPSAIFLQYTHKYIQFSPHMMKITH